MVPSVLILPKRREDAITRLRVSSMSPIWNRNNNVPLAQAIPHLTITCYLLDINYFFNDELCFVVGARFVAIFCLWQDTMGTKGHNDHRDFCCNALQFAKTIDETPMVFLRSGWGVHIIFRRKTLRVFSAARTAHVLSVIEIDLE